VDDMIPENGRHLVSRTTSEQDGRRLHVAIKLYTIHTSRHRVDHEPIMFLTALHLLLIAE